MRGGPGRLDEESDCVTHGQAGTGDFRVLRRAATKGGENTTELGEGFLEDFVCLCQELLKAVDHKHTPVSLWGMAGGNRGRKGTMAGGNRGRKPNWKPLTEVPRKRVRGPRRGGASRAEVKRIDRVFTSHQHNVRISCLSSGVEGRAVFFSPVGGKAIS